MKRIIIAALTVAAVLAGCGTAYADEQPGSRRHTAVQPTEQITETPRETLTREGGVYEYGGRTETYYSSNVLYHYRTGEWTADERGFYRTDEGYYVVAASDMEQGTVFMGSMGLCQVLDSGCDDGTTDYYVNW